MTNKENDLHRYDDMLTLPNPTSKKHPRMSIRNRAAQFAPFAALTGYEDAIHETARLTDEKIELDENRKEILDEKLQILKAHLHEHPKVSVTYFKEDEKKSGGTYLTADGVVKKIDSYTHTVVLEEAAGDIERIAVEDILELSSDLYLKYTVG